MNENISKLDANQMLRRVYDELIDANRVTVVNTELAIELSAADGDSVTAIPVSSSLSAGTYDVAGMKTLCLYGIATLTISPTDTGENFVALSVAELTPTTICARRLRIVGDGLVVVQSV